MTTPRHARVLRYESAKIDRTEQDFMDRLDKALRAAMWACPDCDAPGGEPCFPFCPRYRKAPDVVGT